MDTVLTVTMEEAITLARIVNLAQLEGRCLDPVLDGFLEKVEQKLDELENA